MSLPPRPSVVKSSVAGATPCPPVTTGTWPEAMSETRREVSISVMLASTCSPSVKMRACADVMPTAGMPARLSACDTTATAIASPLVNIRS